MDHDIELRFGKLVEALEKKHGEGVDMAVILFLIGVNELGHGYRTFNKQEKTDLMHIAVCTLLEPYGYYEYVGQDDDNWPHFNLVQSLPPLSHSEQQFLLKEAILAYFTENEYVDMSELEHGH